MIEENRTSLKTKISNAYHRSKSWVKDHYSRNKQTYKGLGKVAVAAGAVYGAYRAGKYYNDLNNSKEGKDYIREKNIREKNKERNKEQLAKLKVDQTKYNNTISPTATQQNEKSKEGCYHGKL